MPQPDLYVVQGDPTDYSMRHPDSAVLLVEVSHGSLAHDRDVKDGIYAAAGIPEYWIVDVASRRMEVRRDPSGGANPGYRTIRLVFPGDSVTPIVAATAEIQVSDLLG